MDPSDQEEMREARPLPCPECESRKGFKRAGKFRSQCLNCNSLVQNSEVNIENQDPQ